MKNNCHKYTNRTWIFHRFSILYHGYGLKMALYPVSMRKKKGRRRIAIISTDLMHQHQVSHEFFHKWVGILWSFFPIHFFLPFIVYVTLNAPDIVDVVFDLKIKWGKKWIIRYITWSDIANDGCIQPTFKEPLIYLKISLLAIKI